MKVVATSDIHGALAAVGMQIPECDLLLIAGDVCPVDMSHEVPLQRHWLRLRFFPWLATLPARHIVWIGGNHDFVCESPGFRRLAREDSPDNVTYIQDEIVEIEGITIYGSPWVPNLQSWAFYKPEVKFLDQSETMPYADIYLMHGPPAGIMDATVKFSQFHPHLGAPYVERAIIKHEIPTVIFGHIHESHGVIERGPTTYRNGAFLNDDYQPAFPPQEFEV